MWSRLHVRWGDPPHVTSPIWGPPPPCKQALTVQLTGIYYTWYCRPLLKFSSGLAYISLIFGDNGHSVTLVDGWKRRFFENDYVTVLVPVYLAHDNQRAHILANEHALKDGTVLRHYCVFVWTSQNDTKTLPVDEDFFKKRRKKSPFSNTNGTCGRGFKLVD